MRNVFFCIIFSLIACHTFAESKDDFVKLTGAVRFNSAIENYEIDRGKDNSYISLDTWFLGVKAHKSGFDLDFQYRFYPTFKTHFIHHAYIGYAPLPDMYIKAGVFQKPFGLNAYASHSWWFQIPYYLGLEDDYDIGVGLTYNIDKWVLDIAYFRQAEPNGPVSDNSTDNAVGNGRYSYDIVPTGGVASGERVAANIRELNQWNARVRYLFNQNWEAGLSLQVGGIYNSSTKKQDYGLSYAAHIEGNIDRFNIKAEYINYQYKAHADNGNRLDIVQMAAYGSPYDVAASGSVYVAGVSYTIPLGRGFISSIQPYIDYSIVEKRHNYAATQHLVPGVLITSGPIYTHIDYALGKNQPWLTSDFGQGLGRGSSDARWNSRFNINIGYYF